MKRKSNKYLVLLFCSVFSLCLVNFSKASQPIAGIHFKVIEAKAENSEEVIEFFSWGCHHCYKFEPKLKHWSKERDIKVKKIPVDFGKKHWKHYVRLFYAMELIGLEQERIEKIFDLVHIKKNKSLLLDDIANELSLGESERANLRSHYRSKNVEKLIEQSKALAKYYRVTGVPAMVFKGRYMTDAALSRGVHGLVSISDYLHQKN